MTRQVLPSSSERPRPCSAPAQSTSPTAASPTKVPVRGCPSTTSMVSQTRSESVGKVGSGLASSPRSVPAQTKLGVKAKSQAKVGPVWPQVWPRSRLTLMAWVWPGDVVVLVPAQMAVVPSGSTWRSRATTQLPAGWPGRGVPSSPRRTLAFCQCWPPSKVKAIPLAVPIHTVSP